MKRALASLTLAFALHAEEVLSSRPIVIAPKRIETKTELPPAVASKPKPEKIAKKSAPKHPAVREEFVVNKENVLLNVAFKPGSIRLSTEAQEALRKIPITKGQKIHISGFGEKGRRNAKQIANLRARVVASFLDEALDGINAKLQWSAVPYRCCSSGAVVEAVE